MAWVREDKLTEELMVAEYVLCVTSLAWREIVWVGACNLRPHLAQLRQLGLRRRCDSPGCRIRIQ